MLRLALAASMLATLAPAAAAEPEELSPRAFHKLVDRVRSAIVKVVSEPRGTAVILGVRGEVVADERLWGKSGLMVEYNGERRSATLESKAPELGLVLLRLPGDDYPAAVVGTASALTPGAALVGLAFDAKGAFKAEVGHFAGAKAVGGITRLRSDVPGPAGTALFNSKGQLVAIHTGRPRATLAIDELRTRFAAKGQ
jgi:hypothetical protein